MLTSKTIWACGECLSICASYSSEQLPSYMCSDVSAVLVQY